MTPVKQTGDSWLPPAKHTVMHMSIKWDSSQETNSTVTLKKILIDRHKDSNNRWDSSGHKQTDKRIQQRYSHNIE